MQQTPAHLRLGVNIDHVATIRNARGGEHPDPVKAALLAVKAGADGITAHLREDRRHIRDEDIATLMAALTVPLNLDMAATREMLDIALKHRPHAACIVPEKREQSRDIDALLVPNRLAVRHIAALGRPAEATARPAMVRRYARCRSRSNSRSAVNGWSISPVHQ